MTDIIKEISIMSDGIALIKIECNMTDDTRIKLENLNKKLQSMIDDYIEAEICKEISEDIQALNKAGVYHKGRIEK